jgi:hypothetical protein
MPASFAFTPSSALTRSRESEGVVGPHAHMSEAHANATATDLVRLRYVDFSDMVQDPPVGVW